MRERRADARTARKKKAFLEQKAERAKKETEQKEKAESRAREKEGHDQEEASIEGEASRGRTKIRDRTDRPRSGKKDDSGEDDVEIVRTCPSEIALGKRPALGPPPKPLPQTSERPIPTTEGKDESNEETAPEIQSLTEAEDEGDQDPVDTDPGLAQIARETVQYLAREERYASLGESWTKRPGCYIGTGWQALHLASIRCTESDPRFAAMRPWHRSLEVRAIFRLAGAMSELGLGAYHEAMRVLDDFLFRERKRRGQESVRSGSGKIQIRKQGSRRELVHRFEFGQRDFELFRALGNAIVNGALALDRDDKSKSEGVRETKIAGAPRVLYPWSPDALESAPHHKFEMIHVVDQVTGKLMPRTEPETEGAPRITVLEAAEEIAEDECVLSENSVFQVATQISYKGSWLCNVCASVLTVPEEAEWRLPRCHSCQAVFCSDGCSGASLDFHDPPCGSRIENYIRQWFRERVIESSDNAFAMKDDRYSARARCLHMLLLSRILEYAQISKTNALELPVIKLLNGNLRKASPLGKGRNLHAPAAAWSFDTHVVLPLSIQKQMGIAPWEDMDMFDGWAMNLLLAKIQQSMVIHKGPRVAMGLNDRAKPFQEQTLGARSEAAVWVGTIHPTLSVIATVNLKKAQRPNVVVSGGRKLFATATERIEGRANLMNSSEAESSSNRSTSMGGAAAGGGVSKLTAARPKATILYRVRKREPWSQRFVEIDDDSSGIRSSVDVEMAEATGGMETGSTARRMPSFDDDNDNDDNETRKAEDEDMAAGGAQDTEDGNTTVADEMEGLEMS